jgi:hypothetical protein
MRIPSLQEALTDPDLGKFGFAKAPAHRSIL